MRIYNRHNPLQHLRQQFQIDWWGHQGIAHWACVPANGLMLVDQTGVNRHVVELFSFSHYSRRFDEHVDDGHGACGSALASRLRGCYFDATDEEIDLLHFACVHHSDGMTQGNATVLTFSDADRLDVGRVGITPNAKYLGTEAARTAAVMAKANRRTQTWCDVYDARHRGK